MRDDIYRTILSGIRNPSSGIRFARRKWYGANIAVKNIGVPHQRELIKRLLSEDEFLLIILDACRYDVFERGFPSHYSGCLKKVYTTSTYTKQYLRTTWPDYYDVTYVAGGPVITDKNFQLSSSSYRPSEHFHDIVHAWDLEYEKELGVTPPEAVTDAALHNEDSRMVVHYFQPHAPYIGEVRLRADEVEADASEQSKVESRTDSLRNIYEKIENGDIPDGRLIDAYESNLNRVMLATKTLIRNTNKRTVITSDHGELLGEDNRYLHGGFPHPILCELPWFEVQGVKGKTNEDKVDLEEDGRPKKAIQEQLRDLGYF